MSDSHRENIITVDDAIRDVDENQIRSKELEYTYDDHFQKLQIGGEKDYAKLQGLKDHFRHKKNWSWFLMALMAFMVGFQSFLIYMVGAKHWDFTGYDWLLPTLMVQYLVQIVGLAVFVVRSLFRNFVACLGILSEFPAPTF